MSFISLNEKVVEEIYLSQSTFDEWNRDGITIPFVQQNVENEERDVRKKFLPEMIPAFGILMSILSVFCFSIVSVIVKVLTQLNSIEILGIRCSFQFLFYMLATLIYNHPFFGQSGHRLSLVLRGIFGTISATCIFLAYRLIPLADASTIHFSSPVFVTILAYFILKERITIIQVITGTVTIIGVIFVAKPEFIFKPNSKLLSNQRLEGTILAITAAFTTAMVLITLRKLKTTPVSVVIMWYSFINVISSLVYLSVMDEFIWPTGWKTWGLLLAVGVCGICDQFFMTLALHYESAGPVSVARTSNIVLAFVWDVLLLSEAFEWESILGACLVSVSIIILGVYKWKHEKPELFESLKYKFYGRRQSDENKYILMFSQLFNNYNSNNKN